MLPVTPRKARGLSCSARLRAIAASLATVSPRTNIGSTDLVRLVADLVEDTRDERILVSVRLLVRAEALLAAWRADRPAGASPLIEAIEGELGGDDVDWRWEHVAEHFDEEVASKEPSFATGRYVYLDRVRSPYNVGSIFRTAEAFELDGVILHPLCPEPNHPRAVRTSRGTVDRLRWWVMSPESLIERTDASQTPLFAIETGGRSLGECILPATGTVVVGAEDTGISESLKAVAQPRVYTIPHGGTRGSLNVATAFGVLCYAWSGSGRGSAAAVGGVSL